MERTVPPSEELEKRVRAAAGYARKTVEAFAEEAGVSKTTLYRVFNMTRHLKSSEVRGMAAVAKLPEEFFTVDFALLPEIVGGDLDTELTLAERLQSLERAVAALVRVNLEELEEERQRGLDGWLRHIESQTEEEPRGWQNQQEG